MENNTTIPDTPIKKIKITNPHYRNFLDHNEMDVTLTEDDIKTIIDNIPETQNKALVILLYYTGCRPIEALRITGHDIKKDGAYIIIRVPASKNGLPRNIYLRASLPLVDLLYNYSRKVFPAIPLFFDNKCNYKQTAKTKKGLKEVIHTSSKFYHRFIKWTKILPGGSIPPYYLRHNRFTKWSIAGMNLNELQIKKGAKTIASVYPYVHSSKELGKKAAKITR